SATFSAASAAAPNQLPPAAPAPTTGLHMLDHPLPLVETPWRTHPDRVVRPGNHRGAPTNSALLSNNWSGMADSISGGTFTAASARWIVPTVAAASVDEYSATWVGVDGFGNSHLVQTGTAQEAHPSGNAYYAWYEFIPAASVPLFSVNPGDQMAASVVQVDADHWTITIDDQTTSQGFSQTFLYDNTDGGPSQGTSAEWIEEAPTVSTGQAILANYGTATFTNIAATTTGGSTTQNSITMTSPENTLLISNPGTFSSGTLPVTFIGPAPTQAFGGAFYGTIATLNGAPGSLLAVNPDSVWSWTQGSSPTLAFNGAFYGAIATISDDVGDLFAINPESVWELPAGGTPTLAFNGAFYGAITTVAGGTTGSPVLWAVNPYSTWKLIPGSSPTLLWGNSFYGAYATLPWSAGLLAVNPGDIWVLPDASPTPSQYWNGPFFGYAGTLSDPVGDLWANDGTSSWLLPNGEVPTAMFWGPFYGYLGTLFQATGAFTLETFAVDGGSIWSMTAHLA
ncbi:MAG TPA: G1 family glutamic endopeptidase, partial [Acidimicrobiales bacterium]|nr:G1 family glutamic endopeptidase [Acidimicrobiales bacterium]